MNGSFDLTRYISLVNAEQRAYEFYLEACEALRTEREQGQAKLSICSRLKEAEQVWHEAHFKRLTYEQ